MEDPNSNKPDEIIRFTEMETVENNKVITSLQQKFLQNHVEVTAGSTSDLTRMIREEKQLYANLAIAYVVQYYAAQKKKTDGI